MGFLTTLFLFLLFLFLSFDGSWTLIFIKVCFYFQSLLLGFYLCLTGFSPRYSSFFHLPLGCLELDVFRSFSKVRLDFNFFNFLYIYNISTNIPKLSFFSLSLALYCIILFWHYNIVITSCCFHIHISLMPAFFNTYHITKHTSTNN